MKTTANARDIWWDKLKKDVICAGLCTQCGSCVGLSNGLLDFKENKGIPLPVKNLSDDTISEEVLPQICYDACPARYCDYPALNKFTFRFLPENWLCGVVSKQFISHASDQIVRRNGASGGLISAVMIHLLETKQVKGVICVQVGKTKPYKAEPIIARTEQEIMLAAQSVYSVTPVNTILEQIEYEDGPFAYVGLPDQVASIRKLQKLGHPGAKKIKFIVGPYMGTQMYFEAIRSFLRSHRVKSNEAIEEEITSLNYRAGEWPGYLQIKLKDGRTLKAEKFYYNYLIPFYITSSSLQLVDFTNELTDISVGDAWSPNFEAKRGGYSVVLARSENGVKILNELKQKKLAVLDPITLDKALDMHGHMIDFKKRGSFIRMSWRRKRPDYGYKPDHIPTSRVFVEWCLRAMFGFGKLRFTHWIVEHIPLKIIGPCFNFVRKSWKGVSKPTKRKDIGEIKFNITSEKE